MTLQPDKLPPSILEALEGRGHLSEQIKNLSPEEAFDEYCNWKGLVFWGPRLRRVLETLKQAEV